MIYQITKICTVKVMIMSRYRYRPITVPLPFCPYVIDRYRFRANVTQRYATLPTVTDRYRILPLLALQALPALPIVI